MSIEEVQNNFFMHDLKIKGELSTPVIDKNKTRNKMGILSTFYYVHILYYRFLYEYKNSD